MSAPPLPRLTALLRRTPWSLGTAYLFAQNPLHDQDSIKPFQAFHRHEQRSPHFFHLHFIHDLLKQ